MRHFIGHLSVDLWDYARANSCIIAIAIGFGCAEEIT